MDRRKRVRGNILTILASCISVVAGCRHQPLELDKEVEVCIVLEGISPDSKAELPQENKVSDISLMIFDENGALEEALYINGRDRHTVNLLKGERYSIFACANFGYRVTASHIDELSDLTFHLAYPDEYREGIPMCARLDNHLISDDTEVKLELVSLMSKISIRMDRSRLTDGVSMTVSSIRIGNCPKRTKVFTENSAVDSEDCFRIGFRHDETECQPLNTCTEGGLSGEISLYMLENIQGQFQQNDIESDGEKVFNESDSRRYRCSFVEIELDYISEDRISVDKPLIYRFYLGEDLNSLDIRRNSHYRITISPKDDGLNGNGWRVDKSGLQYIGETFFEQYPGDYIVGDIGDRIHLGCTITPEEAPFDIGLSYMEDDKREGIYEYEIDPDGHGVTLTLTGPGRGMIYMKAGAPVNESALFVIEVNLPKQTGS